MRHGSDFHGEAGKVLQEILRAERQKAELTQEQLARKTGLSQELISRGENGDRRLTFFQLRALCLAMNVDFVQFAARLHADLCALEANPPPPPDPNRPAKRERTRNASNSSQRQKRKRK